MVGWRRSNTWSLLTAKSTRNYGIMAVGRVEPDLTSALTCKASSSGAGYDIASGAGFNDTSAWLTARFANSSMRLIRRAS